jgi:hypothetical protein
MHFFLIAKLLAFGESLPLLVIWFHEGLLMGHFKYTILNQNEPLSWTINGMW